MESNRVLIVEDEFFVALDLELLVLKQAPLAQVVVCSSVEQARVLAEDRGITCVEVDYDRLRGVESDELKLF